VPTLVVHGESDRLVPPENGRRLARLIAGARLVMIPGASHIFPTDQPETANETILGFLAEQASDVPADSEAQSDQSNNPQPKSV